MPGIRKERSGAWSYYNLTLKILIMHRSKHLTWIELVFDMKPLLEQYLSPNVLKASLLTITQCVQC